MGQKKKHLKKLLLQRAIAVICVMTLLLPTSSAAFASSIHDLGKTDIKSGPFAAMYDSDTVVMEKLETVIEMIVEHELRENTALKPEKEVGSQENEGLQNIGAGGIEPEFLESHVDLRLNETKFRLKEEIIDACLDADPLKLARLKISDRAKTKIESVIEESKEDRYIVKYKTVSGDIKSEISSACSLRSSERNGKTELIILNERLNPKELADSLRDSGAAGDIQYIQPDFKMYFASEESGLSLEICEIEDLIEEPLQEDGGNGILEENIDLEEPEEELGQTEGEIEEEILEPTGEEVIIALIDTGVDIYHSGLAGYLLDGWNFYDDNDLVYNLANTMEDSHGTHIAGIIKNTVKGYNVKIMPLKVFGENGAYTSDILAAITYGQEYGAQVANCSFGSSSYNPALEEAMENSNMLFVAAAGNGRSDLEETPIYPAAFTLDNVISVACLNADKGFSYYSNYSTSLVDIAARGRDVNSTLPEGGYGLQSGTSQAAGYVSAAAGLVLSESNGLDAAALKIRLTETSDRYEHLLNKVRQGRSLNLDNALLGAFANEIQTISYEEDFDVHGYEPTPEGSWALFAAKTVVQVAAGDVHSLALRTDGSVWAWGENYSGQLGDGTFTTRTTPVQVTGLTGIIAIACGRNHSLAVKNDGTIWAWGRNSDGQLGDGTFTNRSAPVQVTGLTGVISAAAGYYHSLAVKSDGTVRAWGDNDGQLGDGTYTPRSTPVQVTGLTGVIAVAGGCQHSLAAKSDGTVRAWGVNTYGQLGDGTTIDRTTSVQVTGLSGAITVASGGGHSLAVKSDGTVRAWGDNWCGQLGDGTSYNERLTSVQVTGLTGAIAVAGGHEHSLALKSDGSVRAWGGNYCGQLGDGTTIDRATTVQVSGLTSNSSIAVAGGNSHSLAVKNDGTARAWGYNGYGQLGDGTTTNRTTPVEVAGLTVGPPELTSLVFSQPSYTAAIPETGAAATTVNITAVALDEYDDPMPNAAISYALVSPYTGVSINSSTGVVTVTSSTAPGTAVIKATCELLTVNVNLVLTNNPGVSNAVTINAISGNGYLAAFSVKDMTSLSGSVFKITYNPAQVTLVDFAAQTPGLDVSVGVVPDTDCQILSHNTSTGELTFKVNKTITNGKMLSGAVTALKFKANVTGSITISVEQI